MDLSPGSTAATLARRLLIDRAGLEGPAPVPDPGPGEGRWRFIVAETRCFPRAGGLLDHSPTGWFRGGYDSRPPAAMKNTTAPATAIGMLHPKFENATSPP